MEDAALADLGWPDGSGPVPTAPPAPPVAAWCGGAAVAVVGSLDKVLWGGLRVGFVRAPAPVALRFARVKATNDLGSSAAGQLPAERLLAAGGPAAFLVARRADLRARYEALAGALRRDLPGWAWDEPAGGLSIWVRLPGGADATAFAQVALRHGVAVATQAALSCSGAHPDRLRLSFSARTAALTAAVARLAAAWDVFAGRLT